MTAVSWRRALVVIVTVAIGLIGTIVALRGDGFPAVDATVPRATRWFVHQQSKRVVLADGFSGKALAALEADTDNPLSVVQSASGVSLLERDAGLARTIDAAALRLGPTTTVGLLTESGVITGVGQPGLIAVEPGTPDGVLLPPDGEPVTFAVGELGADTRISPDGAVWTIVDGNFTRITTAGERQVFTRRLGDAEFTLAGNTPLLFDREASRTRFGDGTWVALPEGAQPSEVVLQEVGPQAPCAWLGTGDVMWCVGPSGVQHQVQIERLDLRSTDRLAVAGDAAAVVRSRTSKLIRIDWHRELLLDGPDDQGASVPPGADLDIASSVDLLWFDDVDGDTVWSVHPWGLTAIRKDDETTPVIDDSGQITDGGDEGVSNQPGVDESPSTIERPPDDNGIDDPPRAFPDAVSSRFGVAVPIVVTANDYDPDGEAIAVVEVGDGDHGDVAISSATTVLYTPEQGFVGTDTFEYAIADPSGTTAESFVTVQVLPVDAPNRAPLGAPDRAETRVDVKVVVDVLANDVDPERDAVQIGSFTDADIGGQITRTLGPTDLQALQYVPPPGSSGTATFSYRPIDALGALGDPVTVQIEIAATDVDNRPPVVQPDALRLRIDDPTELSVLANDRDPDGDLLTLDLDRAVLPDGLEVVIEGDHLLVTARAGIAPLATFYYRVTDGQSEPVEGNVLVLVIDEAAPNQPPVANADSYAAVVGDPQFLDVLANDDDPDGDPFFLKSVELADPDAAVGTVTVQGDQLEYLAGAIDTDDPVFDRVLYTISDGEFDAVGEVTIRVLPEPVKDPPWARDDSASTTTDTPVVIDVLRNDGDPSGVDPDLLRASCSDGSGDLDIVGTQARYTPPSTPGVYTCSYVVANGLGLTATARVIVSVTAPPTENQPPKVGSTRDTVEVGEVVTFDLLDGASDDRTAVADLEILSIEAPREGAVARIDDRTVRYTAPDAPGADSIRFKVGDGEGGVGDGEIVITVIEPVLAPPRAVADSRTLELPEAVRIPVLDNDRDTDAGAGDELIVTDARMVSSGAEISHDDTTVTIVPADDFVGTITAEYDIIDVDGLTDTGTITVTVLSLPNRAPDAVDDTATVVNGGRVVVPIGRNDVDPDADPLTYSIVTPPSTAFGTASIDGSSLVFDAVPGASGSATVRYQVTDGELTDQANVDIQVLPCNVAPPIAEDDEITTGYMQAIQIDLNRWARNGEVIEVSAPLNQPVGTYSPPAGFNGVETITFVVRNVCGLRDTGALQIDVNQSPLVDDQAFSMGRFDTRRIALSDFATDPDGQDVVIADVIGEPSWVTVGGSGTRLDIEPSGAADSVTFEVVVEDVGGLDATARFTVDLDNQAPTANADAVRADDGPIVISPLANDTDPENDALRLQQVPRAVTFTNDVTVDLTVVDGGTRIAVDPGAGVGTATFTYTAVDVVGRESNPAQVTITVNSPPNAPTVNVSMAADDTVTVQVNATDPDPGDTLVLTLIDDPTPLVITVDGLTLTITAPPEARNTLFAIAYRVTDSRGARDRGVLNIDVGDPVPPPTTTTTTTTTLPTLPPKTTPPEQPTGR